MGLHIFAALAVLTSATAAIAADRRPATFSAVNDGGGMCWDPDVEFPVACEEDGD
ncbi:MULTISPECIES: hypothetical protein [unclassified Hyphomicrobium]|uniref:hypothetical protein n=1 Tax=unclassified Hyphomicrobium TaxID=2619925 RepID=UPI000312D3D8|nr:MULTISPECIES: hypothetical protein [unclassified Hyphomicrobium]